jgi:hypothetical protein
MVTNEGPRITGRIYSLMARSAYRKYLFRRIDGTRYNAISYAA